MTTTIRTLSVSLALCLGGSMALLAGPQAWAQQQSSAQASEPAKKVVGTIKTITGLVSLQSAEGKSKFASAGTKLNVGDIINTQKASTAMLEFVDTTQVALRPGTQFVVENYEYQAEQPITDKAEFKLVKGGLRTLTGLIGKRGSQDAFKLKSETATIGIRGTDFAARICKGKECASLARGESDTDTATNLSTVGAAGRVSQLSGTLLAVSAEGKSRTLSKGAAVFPDDTLKAEEGGFAVISMPDSTRLTVPGGSEIQVAAYRYSPESPKTSVASIQLLKGAVRTVTGAIAKAEPGNVKFFTQTATVGIRGTAFDLSCTTQAPTTQGGATLTTCSSSSSTNLEMREGSTQLTTPQGNVVLNSQQSAYVPPNSLQPQLINGSLNVLTPQPASGPLPENQPADFESLSSIPQAQIDQQVAPDRDELTNDLYVAVNDGTIVLTNGSQTPLIVNRGEGAVVRTFSDLPPTLLPAPPRVLSRDALLSAPGFTAPQCAP